MRYLKAMSDSPLFGVLMFTVMFSCLYVVLFVSDPMWQWIAGIGGVVSWITMAVLSVNFGFIYETSKDEQSK